MVANYFNDLPDDLQNTIQVMATHKMYDDVLEEMMVVLTERYRLNLGKLFLFWSESDCLRGDPYNGMVYDEDYGWVWM